MLSQRLYECAEFIISGGNYNSVKFHRIRKVGAKQRHSSVQFNSLNSFSFGITSVRLLSGRIYTLHAFIALHRTGLQGIRRTILHFIRRSMAFKTNCYGY